VLVTIINNFFTGVVIVKGLFQINLSVWATESGDLVKRWPSCYIGKKVAVKVFLFISKALFR